MRKTRKIDDNAMLNPKQIEKMELVLNTKLEPSVFTLYRLIKSGKLKAINLGTGGESRYLVKGRDLKKFLSERYNFTI